MIRSRILSVKEKASNSINASTSAQSFVTTATTAANLSKQQQESQSQQQQQQQSAGTSSLSSERVHLRRIPKQPQLLQSFDYQKWFFSRYRERANVNYLWKANQLYEKEDLELLFQTILKNSPEIYQPASMKEASKKIGSSEGDAAPANNVEDGNNNDDDDDEEIHLEAFFQVMKKQGKENFMDRKTFDQVIQLIDRDGNRMLNKNEFYTMLMSKSINRFFIKLNKESWIKNNLANNSISNNHIHNVTATPAQASEDLSSLPASAGGTAIDRIKRGIAVRASQTLPNRSKQSSQSSIYNCQDILNYPEAPTTDRKAFPAATTTTTSSNDETGLKKVKQRINQKENNAVAPQQGELSSSNNPGDNQLRASNQSFDSRTHRQRIVQQPQNPTVRRRRNTSAVMSCSSTTTIDKKNPEGPTASICSLSSQSLDSSKNPNEQGSDKKQKKPQASAYPAFKQLDLSRVIGSLKYESEREQMLRHFERIRRDKSVEFEHKYATVNSLLNQPHFSVSNIGLSVTESLLTKQQIQSARDTARHRSRRKLASMIESASRTTYIAHTIESNRFPNSSVQSIDPRSGLSTAGNTTITNNFYDVQVDENILIQQAAVKSTAARRPFTEGQAKRSASLSNVIRVGSSLETLPEGETSTTRAAVPVTSSISIAIANAAATSSIIEKRREQLLQQTPRLSLNVQSGSTERQLQQKNQRDSRYVPSEQVKGIGHSRYEDTQENLIRSSTAESMGDRVSTAAADEPELDLQDCFRKTFRVTRRFTKLPNTSSVLFNKYLNSSARANGNNNSTYSPLKHAVTCQIRNEPSKEFIADQKLKHAKTHVPKSIMRDRSYLDTEKHAEDDQQEYSQYQSASKQLNSKRTASTLTFLSKYDASIS